jgi:uncharacterized tellurite resistance protein B-like protein
MAGKSVKRIPTAPLQKLEAVPVTDPAELAALEEAVARNRQVDQATVAEVVERIRQLPAAKRLRATIQLAALLTTDERFQLVKQVLADLPEDVHHRLAERLRG